MILVTGAAGFIGRHVCAALVRAGHYPLAVDRQLSMHPPWHFQMGDIGDEEFVTRLFATHPISGVIHLAAILNTVSRQQPAPATRVNIGGSLNLLAAAARQQTPRFIFASSISAYGTKRYADCGAVSEGEPAAPDTIYGAAKRYVELICEEYRNLMPLIALRIATVIGRGVVSPASAWRGAIIECLAAREPVQLRLPYRAEEILPLIHVDDVATIVSRLLDAPPPLHVIYNTPAENVACGDLAHRLAALNPQLKVILGDGSVRGTPEAIDGARLASEFGIQPRPLEERFREALQ